MSLLKKLAGQTVVYGLSSIVGRLLNYLLVPIYTRIFLTSEYGVVTELYGYVGFLMVIFTYGMETSFFRYVKEKDISAMAAKTALSSLAFTSISLGTLMVLFSGGIAEAINYASHPEYIAWFALILTFDALSVIPFAHIRYKEEAIKFAGIKLTNIAINIGLNLFFLVLCPRWIESMPWLEQIYDPNMGVGYIFISNLVASAVTLLLLLPEILRIRFGMDLQLLRKMLVYALPLAIVGFAGIVNEMLDRVLLKYLLPYDAETNMSMLGIYGACYKLSILMTLFIQAFRYAAEPFFFAQSNRKDAKDIYAIVLKYFSVIGLAVFLLIALFLDFFKHFIGTSYHEGLVVVPILLLANLCLGIYYNLSIWYKLTNNTMKGAAIAIGGALLTVLLNLLLIPSIGYLGSAWATLVCYASMVIVSYLWGKRHYPIAYDLLYIAQFVILALLLFGLDAYTSSRLFADTPLLLYLSKGLYLLMYLGFFGSKELISRRSPSIR